MTKDKSKAHEIVKKDEFPTKVLVELRINPALLHTDLP